MATLIELDTIKTRMAATSAALQEADNWTTLSADAEVHLAPPHPLTHTHT